MFAKILQRRKHAYFNFRAIGRGKEFGNQRIVEEKQVAKTHENLHHQKAACAD